MSDLVARARRAAAWSLTEVFLRQGVQFGTSIVLARLLAPEDFGTLAVAALFVFLAGPLVDGGLTQALMRKSSVRPEEVSSVFWFNLGVSVLLAGGLALGAGAIAAYWGNPATAPLITFMSLSLVCEGAQNAPRAMLTRALRFRALGVATLTAAAVSGGTAIVMARAGYGAWSLAWQSVLNAFVSGVITASIYGLPRPLVFRLAELTPLLRFGSWLVLGSLLGAIKGGFTTFLLGRYFSLRDVGLYSRADGTMNIPSGLLSTSAARVILPVLAESADDPDRLARGARRALLLMMFFNVPVMMGLAISSEMLIGVLFGQKWLASAPYLTALCVAAIFTPLHVVNVQMLLALRHPRRFFYLDLAKCLAAIGVMWCVSGWGVLALAWSQVLVAVLSWGINTVGAHRLTRYGFAAQFLDILPTVLAGIVASAGALALTSASGASGLVGLLVMGVSWTAIFLGAAAVLRLEALAETREMLAPAWPRA